jgi:hypothetical protein
MVYLQSYFDESGTIEKDRILSFCGFVGTNDDWLRCHRKWKIALESVGLQYLKANHILHYTKPLSKICPAIGIDERVKALTPLVMAIRNSVPLSVSVVLDCEAFKAFPEKERTLLGAGDPTYFAFLQAVLVIEKHIGQVVPDPEPRISIVCDENHKYAQQYLEAFHRARQILPHLRKTIVSIGFADDKFFEQLQVADFLASIMRQEAEHRFYGRPFALRRMYDIFTEPSINNIGAIAFLDKTVLAGLIQVRKRRSIEKRQKKLKSK